ncbi:MAG: hypothetical protein JWM11_4510 [Planctomycetaceae bacterium]|nr:hypothetical protein [Planctomycetaceae bacterium]
MPDLATDISESLRCPTCNAAQTWSDECRRCKSDLRLLRRVVEARRQHRELALRALRDGHYSTALAEAQQVHDLYPDPGSKRLLATCNLLAGNWQQALVLARDAS